MLDCIDSWLFRQLPIHQAPLLCLLHRRAASPEHSKKTYCVTYVPGA
jgi:hypothetical protein